MTPFSLAVGPSESKHLGLYFWLGNSPLCPPILVSMSAAALNAEEFATALKGDLPLLVDFYADWCGPCKMMAPVIEQIAAERTGQLQVNSLDVDAESEIAIRYMVMSIPSLLLFKQGQLVDKLVGYPGPAGVRSWLAKNLA